MRGCRWRTARPTSLSSLLPQPCPECEATSGNGCRPRPCLGSRRCLVSCELIATLSFVSQDLGHLGYTKKGHPFASGSRKSADLLPFSSFYYHPPPKRRLGASLLFPTLSRPQKRHDASSRPSSSLPKGARRTYSPLSASCPHTGACAPPQTRRGRGRVVESPLRRGRVARH